MTANPWTDRWDQRYANAEYAYGEAPNNYLKEQLAQINTPGKILFAAEGEGRNAVYAAKQGWTVSAFDISIEGRKKALRLAQNNNILIDYRVGELETLNFQQGEFDAIALIYAHFPANIKSSLNQLLHSYLRPGGIVIFEAFSKNHLAFIDKNEKVGGPREFDMLFSVEEIQNDFPDYEILELAEKVIELNEGIYHNGEGSVIRFTGRKL